MHEKNADSPATGKNGHRPASTSGDRQPADIRSNGSQPGEIQPGGSRPRFEQYRALVKHKKLPKGGIHSGGEVRSAKDRVRSTWNLVWRFFQLLTPYRSQVFWILASLTTATAIGLVPPAGTKFIVDYGLSGRSLPEP